MAFLHKDEACSLKFNSWSILTLGNFSYLLQVTVSLPILIWKLSLLLFMRKWYLSGFASILLSLNHCTTVLAAFSNLNRIFEVLIPVQYGVLPSTYFATEMSWRSKKSSHKKILNSKGWIIDPLSTQNKMLLISAFQRNSFFSIFKVEELQIQRHFFDTVKMYLRYF